MTTPGLRPASYEHGGDEEGTGARARFVVTPVRERSGPLDLLVPRPRRGAPPPQVLWRLLSGNNRQLGRSPRAFASCDDAEAATLAVVASRDVLETVVSHFEGPVRWVWAAHHGTEVVAVSGRSYERERLAAGALATFLEGLRDVALTR